MASGRFKWVLMWLGLGYVWYVLLNQLRLEWDVNVAYHYGYAVPLLCLFLGWNRMKEAGHQSSGPIGGVADREKRDTPPAPPTRGGFGLATTLAVALALLWCPVRLLQEANPQWRLSSWLLALDVVGLTLVIVWLLGGREGFRRFAFPICFFLVAVPWPTVLEWPLIQNLTRLNTLMTTELLGWSGYPAVAQGNTVEIASGLVGVDEACSGIRSFQGSLMCALFLGELYSLSVLRRVTFCLAGFALAFGLNLCRTFILVLVAAKQGVSAIAQWHDPAGMTVLVGCCLGLWLIALVFAKRARCVSAQALAGDDPRTGSGDSSTGADAPAAAWVWLGAGGPGGTGLLLSVGLPVWLLVAELGVESWYRAHESHLKESVGWTVVPPETNPGFRQVPLPESLRQTLRYDQAIRAAWTDPGGPQWQIIYLRWRPGRVAAHLARGHTPELCLPATGRTLRPYPDLRWLEVHGLRLPFRTYQVQEAGRGFYVYHCLWQDRAAGQHFETEDIVTWRSRLANVWAGRRNLGQRSLELAVGNVDSPQAAETAVQRQLQKLIQIEKRVSSVPPTL